MDSSFDFQELREYAFGIVDAGMVKQLPEGVFAQPLVPKRLTQSAHLMPTLIDLRCIPLVRLTVLLHSLTEACENGEPPAIALFIKSDSSAMEIARRWNAMQLAQPRLGRKVWLRLHDPRVLHQLLRILDPMQRPKLFGSSQAFIYWVGGGWVLATRALSPESCTQAHKNGEVLPYAGPARWDWSRIERIGAINRALLGAGINEASALISQGALAEKLIEHAVVRHELLELPDLIEFAIRGLQTNPVFDQHPEVARAIRPRGNTVGDSRLADRFALVDEQVWASLRHSINLPRESRDDFCNQVRVL